MKTMSTHGTEMCFPPFLWCFPPSPVVCKLYRIIPLEFLHFFGDSLGKSSNSAPFCAYRCCFFALSPLFFFPLFFFSFVCPNNCCFAKFNKIIVFLRSWFCLCAHKRDSLIYLACKFVRTFSCRLVSTTAAGRIIALRSIFMNYLG